MPKRVIKPKPGLKAAIARLEQNEIQLHERLQAAMTGGIADDIAVCQRLHKDAVDTLRKATKDIFGVERDNANQVSVNEAQKELTLMAGEIRSLLLTLPRSLAPQLENRKAAEIEALLTSAVDSALATLNKGQT